MVRLFNVYYPTRTVLLLICEGVLIALCLIAATALVLHSYTDTYIALFIEHGSLKIGGIIFLTLMLSYYFDLYNPEVVSSPLEIYFRLLLVLGFACILLSALIFFLPELSIGPAVYPIGFAILAPVLMLWRKFYERVVNISIFRERIYVLGNGSQARTIVASIRSRRDIGIEVIGWRDIELPKEQRKQTWIDDLQQLADSKRPVRRVIVAVDDERNELPVRELLSLRFQGVDIEMAGAITERLVGKIRLDGLRPSNFLYAEGFRVSTSQQFMRQVLSTLAASTGLLLFVPFFPFVALAVRLSSKGPIFFQQTRVGVGGKNFKVVKFRTMFTDAEADGAKWATKNDPRVTRVGGFLRKTRIDEIPQLWNVLRGDMGFVGPRPERPEFVPWLTEELPFYYLRHLIRPGLTGWAQIRYQYGATLAETREKLEYDLYYIKHMSLGLDLLIMFETVKTIVRRRGAQ
jgi:sugar transferase (PEP-CTERM system associated)